MWELLLIVYGVGLGFWQVVLCALVAFGLIDVVKVDPVFLVVLSVGWPIFFAYALLALSLFFLLEKAGIIGPEK